MAALITAIPDLRGLRSKITAAACAFFDVGGRDRADAYTTAKPPRLDTLSFSNEQRSTFLTNFLHDAPSTVYKEKMPSPKSHLSLPRVAARRTHISLQQLMTCGRSLRSHGRNRFDSDQRDDHDPAQRRARLTPPASGVRPMPLRCPAHCACVRRMVGYLQQFAQRQECGPSVVRADCVRRRLDIPADFGLQIGERMGLLFHARSLASSRSAVQLNSISISNSSRSVGALLAFSSPPGRTISAAIVAVPDRARTLLYSVSDAATAQNMLPPE